MADIVEGLYQDEEGNRYAWNGRTYVQVPKGFDPRQSGFAAGLEGGVQDILQGVQQMRAWAEGDDELLGVLEERQRLQQGAQSVIERRDPAGQFAGQITPYVAGAAVGGAPGGAAGVAGATLADTALGAMSYGSGQERALNAAVAAMMGGAGGLALRQLGRSGRSEAIQGAIEEAAPSFPRGAGGSVAGEASASEVSTAAQIAGRMLGLGRADVDAGQLARNRPFLDLARKYGIAVPPSARTGSLGMRQIEDAMMSNPYSARPGMKIRDAYLDKLEESYREALLPGSGAGQVDDVFQRQVTDDIARRYEQIAEASPEITTEGIKKDAVRLTAGESQAAWGPEEHDLFGVLMANVDRFGDQMSGQQAWVLHRRMADEANRQFKNGEFQKGIVYQSVADAIEDQLVRNSEGAISPAELRQLRRRYRLDRIMRSSRAINQDGLSMAKAANALRSQLPREYGEGRGFGLPDATEVDQFLEVLKVGDQLMRPSVGNSGTATRLAIQDLSPSGMGQNMLRALVSGLYYGEPVQGAARATGAGLQGVLSPLGP